MLPRKARLGNEITWVGYAARYDGYGNGKRMSRYVAHSHSRRKQSSAPPSQQPRSRCHRQRGGPEPGSAQAERRRNNRLPRHHQSGRGKAFVHYLGRPLKRLTRADLRGTPSIALVDTQPGAGNNALPPGFVPSIVVDHHPPASSHCLCASLRRAAQVVGMASGVRPSAPGQPPTARSTRTLCLSSHHILRRGTLARAQLETGGEPHLTLLQRRLAPVSSVWTSTCFPPALKWAMSQR